MPLRTPSKGAGVAVAAAEKGLDSNVQVPINKAKHTKKMLIPSGAEIRYKDTQKLAATIRIDIDLKKKKTDGKEVMGQKKIHFNRDKTGPTDPHNRLAVILRDTPKRLQKAKDKSKSYFDELEKINDADKIWNYWKSGKK
ncbi:hypothetical protein AMATHDRAFT_1275 [Amanita thiersii Skay4041]|uniref:Uncharacterized protein n=1 Tax=Amanita thiersii Skay4041 TaxID=703135 RepID=A0A2A9NSX2_9AGAR|nr:hypothetical protein AMATHDRAFT_1275 [Amanita thiersii Skay4041]